ncbi:hypothetical protein RRG08_061198 [Elysia crispata]|uniref:Uncharacterized protein n=1 Tax=Elysia crispata TaxID=231223 RepID=A0AAE0ZMC5_9GAST|nr:hypothetical protein RRG08_061198 [Elysia crispata]
MSRVNLMGNKRPHTRGVSQLEAARNNDIFFSYDELQQKFRSYLQPSFIKTRIHLVQTFKALEWNKIVERSQTLGRAQRDRTTRLNTLSKTSVIYEWKEEHQDTKRGRMRERKDDWNSNSLTTIEGVRDSNSLTTTEGVKDSNSLTTIEGVRDSNSHTTIEGVRKSKIRTTTKGVGDRNSHTTVGGVRDSKIHTIIEGVRDSKIHITIEGVRDSNRHTSTEGIRDRRFTQS